MKRNNTLAVIGGGAAGLMAALFALRAGAGVTVFEPNERLGRKLNITGKGRCNLTNLCDRDEFLRHVTKNGRFLYSALAAFSPSDVMELFESLGVPLKVERGRRVFPVSDKASDIVSALERATRDATVLHRRADRIVTEEGRVTGVQCGGVLYPHDAVILAPGGASYPRTGSDGNGYRLATEHGHTLTKILPSLVPLVSPSEDCPAMQGLSLKNVTLSLIDEKGKVLFTDFGEMLFTHFGISGPLVLSASARLRDAFPGTVTAKIDLKPALDEETLTTRLLSDFKAGANSDFSTILGKLLPSSMIPVAIRTTGIPKDKKGHALTREDRLSLLRFLKGYTLPITGFRPIEEAIVTAGGISVNEVNPKSLMSKLTPGLFFAGEILDLDAETGGYNLQIAFSTGKAAGEAAARYLNDTCKGE